MKLTPEQMKTVASMAYRCWQEIGSDAMALGNLKNSDAIELILDADRLEAMIESDVRYAKYRNRTKLMDQCKLDLATLQAFRSLDYKEQVKVIKKVCMRFV